MLKNIHRSVICVTKSWFQVGCPSLGEEKIKVDRYKPRRIMKQVEEGVRGNELNIYMATWMDLKSICL